MKKFILSIFALALSVALNAQGYQMFLKGTINPNGEGQISLYLQNADPLMMVQSTIALPEGVVATGITSTTGVKADGNWVDGVYEILFLEVADVQIPVSSEPVEIAKISVMATDVELGEQPASITNIKLGEYPTADPVGVELKSSDCTITVQRAVEIDGLPEGFGVEVIPFTAVDGDMTLAFQYKSAKDIKNISFDVELPAGMAFIDDDEWDRANVTSSLLADNSNNPTYSYFIEEVDAPTTATIKVAGAYTAKSKKYVNNSNDFAPFATISACVMTQDDVDEFGWEGDVMTDGISTIKLSNITIEDTDGNKYTGEYLASVFFGTPEETDPIVYGHYTTEGTAALQAAAANFASVDMTSATIDEGCTVNDVLVLTKEATSYNRANGGIATICLPYELTSSETTKYYTLKEINAKTMTFEEVETVPANTPALVLGTIATCAEGYIMPGTAGTVAVAGTTMTGTYEKYDLATGAGYYIAGGKFYSDGATVKPFRAYFDGVVTGVKSFSVQIETATGIIDVTDQLSNEDIYSLQGIKMNKTQKGVNIVGNKKVYVK